MLLCLGFHLAVGVWRIRWGTIIDQLFPRVVSDCNYPSFSTVSQLLGAKEATSGLSGNTATHYCLPPLPHPVPQSIYLIILPAKAGPFISLLVLLRLHVDSDLYNRYVLLWAVHHTGTFFGQRHSSGGIASVLYSNGILNHGDNLFSLANGWAGYPC